MNNLVKSVEHKCEFLDIKDILTGEIKEQIVLSETVFFKDKEGNTLHAETIKPPWRFKQSWIDSILQK